MRKIYGPLIEHNEYPVTDERHFTITILPHVYVEGEDVRRDACNECMYPEDMPFHCSCAKKHPLRSADVHYTSCPLYQKKEICAYTAEHDTNNNCGGVHTWIYSSE